MSCFICDLVAPESNKILDTMTSYRGKPLYNILYDFISKFIDVEIDDDDIVCDTCSVLFDASDRFRCELDNVEHMLQLQIERKYKLSETQVCRLDDRTARNCHRGTGKRFGCVECSFETDFADCLMPHSWYHEHQTVLSRTTSSEADCSFTMNVCHTCNLGFSTDELLESHVNEFHADDADSNANNDAWSAQLDLEVDVQSENDEGNEIIEAEARIETTENSLTAFMQCEKCPTKCDSRRALQQHSRSVHFLCEICNTKCRSETTLQAHILRQHTKHVCDKCGKVLGSLSSHRAHQATHGIDLKFMCPHCDKGFRAKSQLDHHIVIHTKECNFTCHICGQKFIHQRSHRLHIQWHTNPRPYKCPHCNKTYKHISHLAVHRRSHSGELPKACQCCDKRFASASKLKVHMVKHTGVYSHPCQLCSRGYMKRYKLAEHMLSAHGDNTMIANKPQCEYKMMIRPELMHAQAAEKDI